MKILALVLAVACFAVSALYISGHFPGTEHHRHLKHGVAFLLVGVLGLVWARMQGATPAASRP